MKVHLIASSYLSSDFYAVARELGFDIYSENEDVFIQDTDILSEFAGRTCYLSYDKPNPNTASNKSYLSNIIQSEHFSVLEHGTATFYIAGCSRNLLLELERHRHLSLSVVSTRYVDPRSFANIVPSDLKENLNEEAYSLVHSHYKTSVALSDALYAVLRASGVKKKQARSAARSVLPGSTETRFVVTGNMRTWREFIQKRNTEHADREIRTLAQNILVELREISPNIFQDLI